MCKITIYVFRFYHRIFISFRIMTNSIFLSTRHSCAKYQATTAADNVVDKRHNLDGLPIQQFSEGACSPAWTRALPIKSWKLSGCCKNSIVCIFDGGINTTGACCCCCCCWADSLSNAFLRTRERTSDAGAAITRPSGISDATVGCLAGWLALFRRDVDNTVARRNTNRAHSPTASTIPGGWSPSTTACICGANTFSTLSDCCLWRWCSCCGRRLKTTTRAFSGSARFCCCYCSLLKRLPAHSTPENDTVLCLMAAV